MGEAKRRKQILKEDYGKKIPKLTPGTPLFDNHVKKFFVAFTERISEISQKLPSSQPTKIEEETFKTWVSNYLGKYEKTDQKTLVMIIIGSLDESFNNVSQAQELGFYPMITYLFTKVFVHKILNPFLPEEIAKSYNKSFQDCYDKIVEGIPEEVEEGEEEEVAEIELMIEQIRQNIAEFLELED